MDGNDLGVVRLLIAKTSNVLQPNDNRVEFHGARSRRHADKALHDTAGSAAIQVAEGDDVCDKDIAAWPRVYEFEAGSEQDAGTSHTLVGRSHT